MAAVVLSTFNCDKCTYSTDKKGALVKHSRIHSVRPNPCVVSGCSHRALTLQNLDRHMAAKHPNEAQKLGPMRRVRKSKTAIGTAEAAGTGGGGGGGGGDAPKTAAAAAAVSTTTTPAAAAAAAAAAATATATPSATTLHEKNLTFDEFNQTRVAEYSSALEDYSTVRTLSLPKSAWMSLMTGFGTLFTPYQIKRAQDQKGQLLLTPAECIEYVRKEADAKNRAELDVRRAVWGDQAAERKADETIRYAKIEAVQKELTKTMSNYVTKADFEKEVKVDGPTRVHAIAEKFFAALFRNDSKAFDEKEVAAVTEIATRMIRRTTKDAAKPMYTISDAELELEAEFGALGSDPATGKLVLPATAAAAEVTSPVSHSNSDHDDDDDDGGAD